MSKYLDLSLKEIHELLKSKKIKIIDLVLESFERIEENKDLNAFITLNKEEAIKKANELDLMEVDNLLFGLPIAIKDNILTKDLKTTAASKMLENFMPVLDAHVVSLIKEKNMIIVGKLNLDEFAMGGANETSYFGPVKNPHNKKLVAGGSSGGSAAAVAAGLVPFALGSDTGGSIRLPSSYCGIVGLKPTYGRISRNGLIAFASSLDQIGPMTRNVYENACLLNILCKKDNLDLTNVDNEEDFTKLIGTEIKGLKIAIPNYYMNDSLNIEIKNKVLEVVSLLEEKGVTINYVDIPYLDYTVPLYQVIALGEASSNLARYDGIKYGFNAENYLNYEDLYRKTRSEGFGAEVKRRIMVGSYLLSGKNAKEYYTKALIIRNNMKLELEKVLKEYDLIIGPTTCTLPKEIGINLNDPLKSFLDDVFLIPANMSGLPCMSLPVGFSKDNLPIGMQIMGQRFGEASIYKLAYEIEQSLNLDLARGGKNYE